MVSDPAEGYPPSFTSVTSRANRDWASRLVPRTVRCA
jgi:hypothetical protein